MSSFPFVASIFLAFLIYPTSSSLSRQNFSSGPSDIIVRASTCPDPAYVQCPQSSVLPSNFCCPSASSCVVLAANTTVLCCPNGVTCQTIKSIPCDISALNVTLHPDNDLKTTALLNALPICGSACCPFGYSCNSATNCGMNTNQEDFVVVRPPSSTMSIVPPSTSSTTTTSGTSTSSPTTTGLSSAARSSRIDISVGTMAGIIVAIICSLTLMFALIFWILHRRSIGFRIFTGKLRRSISSFRKAELDTSSLRRESEMSARELDGRSVHEVGGREMPMELDGNILRHNRLQAISITTPSDYQLESQGGERVG
ncbi:uncharacterized protein PAC_16962 [Phialocephala subalpina]|uniref:Mid2 domain-containing protein n=1 Tax=Phialocephala subalpina TaxID=576137 RepID=A0A1L7XPW5_9HELO|nr:uncharacterized protein PAC_16962 [Phialocephala subalpina]